MAQNVKLTEVIKIVGKREIVANHQCPLLSTLFITFLLTLPSVTKTWPCWNRVNAHRIKPFSKQALVFACQQYKSYENTVGKRRNCSFSHSVVYPFGEISINLI